MLGLGSRAYIRIGYGNFVGLVQEGFSIRIIRGQTNCAALYKRCIGIKWGY